MSLTRDFTTKLQAAYTKVQQSKSPQLAWLKCRNDLEPWPRIIFDSLRQSDSERTLSVLRPFANITGELIALDLIGSIGNEGKDHLAETLEMVRDLTWFGSANASELARGILESLVVAIEAVPEDSAQEIVDCLCDLAEKDIGTQPNRRTLPKGRKHPHFHLHDVLNAVLYNEVVRFYTARRDHQLQKIHQQLVSEIKCPIISVGSRKGGTGKSTFLAGTVLWLKSLHPNARICILDLDLSGPAWQYLLFPDTSRPRHFLDDLLDTKHQKLDSFDFGNPTQGSVMELVEEAEWPFGGGGKIAHLGFRDLPGSNRTIRLATEISRSAFYPFLAKILSILSTSFDTILIDNSPGFDGTSYCSLGVCNACKSGVSFVLSTPAFPDLTGTFLDMADFRLIDASRAPVWIINKSTPDSRRFIRRKWTAFDVAKCLKAFDGVLPDVPVLRRTLKASKPVKIWRDIPMCPEVKDFYFVSEAGPPAPPDLRTTQYVRSISQILDKTALPAIRRSSK